MTFAESSSHTLAGRNARALVRWLAAGAVLLSLAGVALGMAAPAGGSADWTIVYVHVPAAWLSLILYGLAIAAAAATLQLSRCVPPQLLGALAPAGVAAAFLALWTGLTSQQARGAWWGWDARLVSELVLLLLFAALIALRRAIDDPVRAERAGAVVVLVGALNIPIVYLSVNWWHTLHERAAASVGRSPLVIAAMAVMTLAFCMYAGAVVLARLETVARGRTGSARNFATARTDGDGAAAAAKEQQ